MYPDVHFVRLSFHILGKGESFGLQNEVKRGLGESLGLQNEVTRGLGLGLGLKSRELRVTRRLQNDVSQVSQVEAISNLPPSGSGSVANSIFSGFKSAWMYS